MSCVRLLRVIAAASLCCGCLNSSTLIKVKPDGSGTIEQTALMNTAVLKSMMTGLDPQAKMKAAGPFSEADLQRAAERMGKGVRLVSSTPLSQGGFEGTKAIFAFDDINQIRVDQDPNLGGPAGAQPASSPRSPVIFTHARQGSASMLTVTVDEKTGTGASSAARPSAPGAIDPAMMQMMKMMFQGFKIGIDLEVEGTIVKTNADYVSGSRITLMEIDMAGVLEDEAKLRELQTKAGPGASIAEIKPLLKDVKGVKINHSVVTVEYR